jgi:hypothetical protein
MGPYCPLGARTAVLDIAPKEFQSGLGKALPGATGKTPRQTPFRWEPARGVTSRYHVWMDNALPGVGYLKEDPRKGRVPLLNNINGI